MDARQIRIMENKLKAVVMVRVKRTNKTIVVKHFGVGLRTIKHALTDEHGIKQALDTKQQPAGSKSPKGAQLLEVRGVSNSRRDCAAQTLHLFLLL